MAIKRVCGNCDYYRTSETEAWYGGLCVKTNILFNHHAFFVKAFEEKPCFLLNTYLPVSALNTTTATKMASKKEKSTHQCSIFDILNQSI